MNYTSSNRRTLWDTVLAISAAAIQFLLADPSHAANADPIATDSWSLAILPDTQYYARDFPATFNAQTQWIKDHHESHKIQYVLHVGDIVHNNTVSASNLNPNTVQWGRARSAMSLIDGVVPYALAAGNHDYGPNGDSSTRDTYFNDAAYFGMGTPYASQPSIGGFYEIGNTDNSYHTFRVHDQDWLVLALEFGPRDEVVAWANNVVSAHSDHHAILVNHTYLYHDNALHDHTAPGHSGSPYSYGIADLPGGVNDGRQLWEKLVSQHDNFRLVFNGHVVNENGGGDGTGYLASYTDGGSLVHQMLSNYQTPLQLNGGNGFLRYLEFAPNGDVTVRTYSPTLGKHLRTPDQEFSFSLTSNLPPPPVYRILSENFDAVAVPQVPGFLDLTDSTPETHITVVQNAPNNVIRAQRDAENRFGQSVDNQILHLRDAHSSSNPGVFLPAALPRTTSTGFQINFDFYHPDDGTQSGSNGTRVFLSLSSTVSDTASRTVELRFSNTNDLEDGLGRLYAIRQVGATAAGLNDADGFPTVNYALDEKHHLVIVGNYGDDAITYANGTESVAPGTYDVWLNGVRVWELDIPFRHDFTDPATRFLGISGSSNAAISNTYFDNIEVWNTIVYNPFSVPSDFNGDGMVNAADYALWRDTNGGGYFSYETWKSNFGYGTEDLESGGIVSVPEPMSLAIAVVGIGLFAAILFWYDRSKSALHLEELRNSYCHPL